MNKLGRLVRCGADPIQQRRSERFLPKLWAQLLRDDAAGEKILWPLRNTERESELSSTLPVRAAGWCYTVLHGVTLCYIVLHVREDLGALCTFSTLGAGRRLELHPQRCSRWKQLLDEAPPPAASGLVRLRPLPRVAPSFPLSTLQGASVLPPTAQGHSEQRREGGRREGPVGQREGAELL